MTKELLEEEQVSYDMLCHIVDQTLRRAVSTWCYNDFDLRGKGLEEDILQDIQLRVIKTVIPFFLLRDGTLNDDPVGFQKWLFTVGANIKRDYGNRFRKQMFTETAIDERIAERETEEILISKERIALLAKAVDVVLNSDTRIYKILTWFAQSLLMLRLDVTKIESNLLILSRFSEVTLSEMLSILLSEAKSLPWLVIEEKTVARLQAALSEKREDGIPLGECRYQDFFMKKGGKATISDWVNRINHTIAKQVSR